MATTGEAIPELTTTDQIKAYARKVANELPERLLKGEKPLHRRTKPTRNSAPIYDIEQSYNQLDGEWWDWLEVARKYEHRVPAPDRYDMRHTIIVELHQARQRDGKPIPLLRAYRIASLTVALYWRHAKRQPTMLSLDEPTTDYAGNESRLRDTVADDNAIDLDEWLDAKTFRLGCPMRLIEVATKRLDGIPLDAKDKMYLQRFRQKEQKRLF